MSGEQLTRGKVVLAFSGGLDTSFCLVFLREQGWDVITVTVDTGGSLSAQIDEIGRRAMLLGAAEHIVVDGRRRLYDDFVSYLIKANYLRNGTYPSCTGAERTVIAEEVAAVALQRGATAIAHGSTRAGNDHIRFDATILAVAPEMEIVTPIRDEGFTREHETEYLRTRGVEVAAMTSAYSVNEGMLGTTIGGRETDGSWDYLPDEAWLTTSAIDEAPSTAEDIVIDFRQGLPAGFGPALGEAVATVPVIPGHELLTRLGELGGRHGIGRGTHVGTTIMGIQARLGFEAPGLLILIAAHREIERLTLTSRQLSLKAGTGSMYGDLLHEGMYADPVMRDIEAFLDSASQRVTGRVRLRLFKGNVIVLGARSPFSLLESTRRLGSTYAHSSTLWTGAEARGFAKLYGLPSMIANEALRDGPPPTSTAAETAPAGGTR